MTAPAGSAWDDLARLAASVAGCPIAFLALEGRHGPELRAQVGLAPDDGDADALCAHALWSARDAGAGCEVAGADEGSVWLACCLPLVDGQGRVRGALCVGAAQPRRVDGAAHDALAALARIASALAAPELSASAPVPGATATGAASMAVAIVDVDVGDRAPDARDAMLARIERVVAAVVGAGDVVSRHDARELLLVFADPARASATLERVHAAIETLPDAPRVTTGLATDARGPVSLEDLFLEAEADLRRARGRSRPIVFVPAAGGTA